MARAPAKEWFYLSRSGCIHSNDRQADERKATTSHRAPMGAFFSVSDVRTEAGKRRRKNDLTVKAIVDKQREVKIQDNKLFAEVSIKEMQFGFVQFGKTHPKSSPGAGQHHVLRSRTDIGQFRLDDSAKPDHIHIHIKRLHCWATARARMVIRWGGGRLAESPSPGRQEVKRRC